jgi:hypothetical protein
LEPRSVLRLTWCCRSSQAAPIVRIAGVAGDGRALAHDYADAAAGLPVLRDADHYALSTSTLTLSWTMWPSVVLVMIYHGIISYLFTRTGWIGVDLFFVLSGFLISGLLFSEYKKRRAIGFKRFFIRRGLKIYLAFYVFLLLTAIVSYGVLGGVTSRAS